MTIVDIKDVSKSFSKNKVLNNISLTLDKGEVLGLIGPSGSGKTTLVKVIIGMEKQDSGSIKVLNILICQIEKYFKE